MDVFVHRSIELSGVLNSLEPVLLIYAPLYKFHGILVQCTTCMSFQYTTIV